MTTRRKLVEVALPVEEISVASRRDKDRKVGTIKNVHKWFAPMPTPAWRALLFAALVDDPEDADERADLIDLVKRLVPDHGGAPPADALERARKLIAEQHPELPVVFDPFCGAGSTIVEAQRLGFSAAGSDLNPVPVLISRALTELIPVAAGLGPVASSDTLDGLTGAPLDGLLSDLRHYGLRVAQEVQEKVGHLYPPDTEGITVAWLWARTVTCPNPACGATIPLYSSPYLSKRKGDERWLRPVIEGGLVRFEIGAGAGPPPAPSKVGTRGARFRCLVCGEIAPESHLRNEAQSHGLGTQLLAIAVDAIGGRTYRVPTNLDDAALVDRPDEVPDVDLPDRALGFRVQLYGMRSQADLYTPRQLHALGAFSDAVAGIHDKIKRDGGSVEYARTITTLLGLCVGKLAQSNSTQVRWSTREGTSRCLPAFGRHAMPMVWDFAEANPFAASVGGWSSQIETLIGGVRSLPLGSPATVVQRDARDAHSLVPAGSAMIATDPPYYGQIGYADLSDYFYVWERRALREVHPDLFGTISTPKANELIATPYRHDGNAAAALGYFVNGFTEVFRNLQRASSPDLPILVVYAHRQEEAETEEGLTSTAWDAMLAALLDAGLAIVGTWPVHATHSSRQIGQDTNALASYIVMVCRPRQVDAGVTDRQGFLRVLRAELAPALRTLQDVSIPPLDLTQAAIGPGMAVFSRFSRVVEADGKTMPVRTALGLINQVRSELLSELEDEFDSQTRWALQWFEEYGFDEGPFGRAEVLFTATATSLEGLRRSGVIDTRAPKVWLRAPEDLPEDWDPESDPHTSVWEATMHLVKRLTAGRGESDAAELLRRCGRNGELARDLAYRVADTCERKKWAKLALSFNALVVAWPEITRLAAELPQERLL